MFCREPDYRTLALPHPDSRIASIVHLNNGGQYQVSTRKRNSTYRERRWTPAQQIAGVTGGPRLAIQMQHR